MPYKTTVATVPAVQTERELLAWLIDKLKSAILHQGFVILDSDDIAALLEKMDIFQRRSFQNESQPTTDTEERRALS